MDALHLLDSYFTLPYFTLQCFTLVASATFVSVLSHMSGVACGDVSWARVRKSSSPLMRYARLYGRDDPRSRIQLLRCNTEGRRHRGGQ